MFDIKKTNPESMVVIRAATGNELSNYEKNKLANIEENAQRNKLETIIINGQRVPIDTTNKEANIELGDLAFKAKVTADDIDSNDIIFIRCELDK